MKTVFLSDTNEIQKELYLNMQILRGEHENGSEEFKVELKKYQKEFAKNMVSITTKEQRAKWNAHNNSKK